MSLCFDELIMFKPLSSRPANSERYLLCKGRKNTLDIQPYIEVLRKVANSYSSDFMVSSFINNLPENYTSWLTNTNNESVERQTTTGNNILKVVANEKININSYDIHKCFIYWNIPDNIQTKYSKIKIYN